MAVQSGDLCPVCRAGRVGVVRSMRSGDMQVRYLRCPRCGSTAKQTMPADIVRRRLGKDAAQ